MRGIQLPELTSVVNQYARELHRAPETVILEEMYAELDSIVRLQAGRLAVQPAIIANVNASKDDDDARRRRTNSRRNNGKKNNRDKSNGSDACRHCGRNGHRQADCWGLSRSGKRGPAYDPTKARGNGTRNGAGKRSDKDKDKGKGKSFEDRVIAIVQALNAQQQ